MELDPTPARIAHVVVRRCLDRMSFGRITHSLAGEGIVSGHVLRTWLEDTAKLLDPLVHAMWADASRQSYLACDVVEHGVHDTLWVVATPSEHVLFTLDLARVRAMLSGFDGFLVSDSLIVDEHLERANPIDHPWITTRRKFLATLAVDPEHAREALAKIAAVHARRRELGFVAPERRRRQQLVERLCQPLVLDFLTWCARWRHKTVRLGIDPALRHVERHHAELESFFRDARDALYPPRERPRLVEREAGCTLLSLLVNCHAHGLDPERYLHDLLLLWPVYAGDPLTLSPARWRAHCR